MAKIGTLAAKVTLDTQDLMSGVILTKREFAAAGDIIKAQRGPIGEYEDAMKRLQKLQFGGGLSTKQHADAVKQLQAEFSHVLVGTNPFGKFVEPVNHFRTELLRTTPIVGRFVGSISPMATAVQMGVTGFGALAGAIGGATVAMGGFVANRIEQIDEIGDAAARVGMSVSGLSKLQSMAILGDTDPALASTSIQKMLVNVGKGDDEFAKLNLDVNELKNLAPDEIFSRVATAIGGLATTSDKLKSLKEIFGKGGGDLLPLIDNFAALDDAVRKSGAVVSDELGAKVNALDNEWKKLKLTTEGFGNVLTSMAVDPLTGMVKELNAVTTNAAAAHVAVDTLFSGLPGKVVEGLTPIVGMRRAIHDVITLANVAKQEQLNALPIKSDSAKTADSIKVATEKERQDEEKASAKAESDAKRKTDERARMLQDAKDRATEFGRGPDELAREKMARLGGSEEEQHALALEIQKLEVLKEQERAREQFENAEKQRNKERATRTKAIKKEAEGIVESALPDKEKMAAEFARKRGVLEAAGMATPERIAMLAKQEAMKFGGDKGGAFGAPGAAVKGSAAAREITEGNKHAEQQVKLLEQTVRELEKIAGKAPVDFVVVGD